MQTIKLAWPILGILSLAACGEIGTSSARRDPPPATAVAARAYGIWTPNTSAGDTCSKEIHDRYWTYGPDGKVYPTWHPPVDPDTGCTFGHEHGRDPAASKLSSIGLPFGYVNELLSPSDPAFQRNEDHVGHKVEWENGVTIERDGRAYATCDLLFKLHQGTHSPDALTNNLHELFYYARCSDGTSIQWRNLQAFGHAGKVHSNCADEVTVGTPTPVNSPDGGGERKLPAKSCLEGKILVAKGANSEFWRLTENWVVGVFRWAKYDNNKEAMSFGLNPYFQVNNPSRFFDPTATNKIGRPLDYCFVRGELEARGETCDVVRKLSPTGMVYTDSRSPFDGTQRAVHFNNLNISNAGGPTKWYSDVFGEQLRTTPDPGKGITLEQFIASVDNTPGDKDFRGPTIERNYDHAGVHAPN